MNRLHKAKGDIDRKPTNFRRAQTTADKNTMIRQTKTELAVTRLVENNDNELLRMCQRLKNLLLGKR